MTAQSIFSLPEEVQQSFNDIQQLYTERKYQSCVPLLDGILENYPNCIEALSLKGLIYRNIPERRNEALSSIKTALRLDIKSDVAWHALGGYYLVEGHYEQAIKSLTQAVAVASSPTPMLRDLSRAQLMAQKNYNLVKTHQSIFIKDRNSKLDWLTIPLVIDLCDRPAEAATVLGSWFRLPLELRSRCTSQWLSQIRVYLAELLDRANSPKAAIAHTTAAIEIDTDFRCTPQAQEITGRCALALGDWPLAQSAYEYLLSCLPNNMDAMIGLAIADPDFHRILPSPVHPVEATVSTDGPKLTDVQEPRVLKIPAELYPDIITRRGVRSTANVTRTLMSITHKKEHSKLPDCNTGELKTAYNRGDLWRLFWAGEISAGEAVTTKDVELYINFVDRFETLAAQYKGANEVLRLFPLAFLPRHAVLDEIVVDRLTTWAKERLLKGSVAIIAQAVTLSFSRKRGYEFILDVLDRAMELIRKESLEKNTCVAVSEAIYHAARSRVLRRVAKMYKEADGELTKAMEILPTMIDLHVFKAQDLEEDGDLPGALKLMNYCAQLNSADKQLCSDAAIKLCASGDVINGLKLLDSFNKKQTPVEPTDEESFDASKFDSQDQELELALCRGLLEHGHVMDKEIAARLHWAMTRLALNQEEVQDFFKYALRIGNMSALADYIRYVRRIYVIKLAQKAGALLARLLFYKVDHPEGAADQDQEGAIPPELKEALIDKPCEIPTKDLFILDECDRDQILQTILPDLLRRFRADADVQTFGMLRLTYQLHTRAENRKDYILAYCLSQTHNLVDRDILNGKFVRIFLHHLCVEYPNANVKNLLREELQNINVQQYIDNAHNKLARSDDIRDRFYLICAYEDCLAASSRHQGSCTQHTMISDLLAQTREWLKEDDSLLRSRCRASYERVSLRIRRRAFLQN